MSKSSKNKNKNNEIVIKAEEINDYVDSFFANKIGDIYDLIKEECRFNSIPVLDNPTHNSYGDFVNLILECVDSNQIFRDNNKLDT
tara:strand:+ start:817 stop:1074 length:258 start_codon:yes stop_codon:yes gene_type:complete